MTRQTDSQTDSEARRRASQRPGSELSARRAAEARPCARTAPVARGMPSARPEASTLPKTAAASARRDMVVGCCCCAEEDEAAPGAHCENGEPAQRWQLQPRNFAWFELPKRSLPSGVQPKHRLGAFIPQANRSAHLGHELSVTRVGIAPRRAFVRRALSAQRSPTFENSQRRPTFTRSQQTSQQT